MSNTISIERDASAIQELKHTISILGSDGKVMANRCFLKAASKTVRNILKAKKDTKVLDWSGYQTEVIEALLSMIYNGYVSCPTNEEQKEDILNLAEELQIKVKLEDTTPQEPAAENEEEKEDFVWVSFLKSDDKYTCNRCHKQFARKCSVLQHYREIHLTDQTEKGKNIKCLRPGCKKTFAVNRYMVDHMRRYCGVSGKVRKVKAKRSRKIGDPEKVKEEPLELTEATEQ